jgi:hypothetical protein
VSSAQIDVRDDRGRDIFHTLVGGAVRNGSRGKFTTASWVVAKGVDRMAFFDAIYTRLEDIPEHQRIQKIVAPFRDSDSLMPDALTAGMDVLLFDGPGGGATWGHISKVEECPCDGTQIILRRNKKSRELLVAIRASANPLYWGWNPSLNIYVLKDFKVVACPEALLQCGSESKSDGGAEERKQDAEDRQPRPKQGKSKRKRVVESEPDSGPEVTAVEVVKESWGPKKLGYPQRVFSVLLSDGTKSQTVADDADDVVKEPAEENPFYTEVIKTWRQTNDVPVRPVNKRKRART